MHHSNSVAFVASMLDPERPHSIPSSPISVFSDDDQASDLPEAAEALPGDSVPIFANDLADAETVPEDPTVCLLDRGGFEAHAAENPSVCLLDGTGSSAEDESCFETQYSKLRSTQNLEELKEHVIGSSTWTTFVLAALNPLQTSN